MKSLDVRYNLTTRSTPGCYPGLVYRAPPGRFRGLVAPEGQRSAGGETGGRQCDKSQVSPACLRSQEDLDEVTKVLLNEYLRAYRKVVLTARLTVTDMRSETNTCWYPLNSDEKQRYTHVLDLRECGLSWALY